MQEAEPETIAEVNPISKASQNELNNESVYLHNSCISLVYRGPSQCSNKLCV